MTGDNVQFTGCLADGGLRRLSWGMNTMRMICVGGWLTAMGWAAAAAEPVAVVELFTSQGCSSCPPADAVLSRVDELAREKKLSVYVLSFHVDYWNRLGWTDPYSDDEFTRRQNQYAGLFRSNRVYTPQMIVNGQTEFVGSDAKRATQAIRRALTRDADHRVRMEVEVEAESVRVRYDAGYSGDKPIASPPKRSLRMSVV